MGGEGGGGGGGSGGCAGYPSLTGNVSKGGGIFSFNSVVVSSFAFVSGLADVEVDVEVDVVVVDVPLLSLARLDEGGPPSP